MTRPEWHQNGFGEKYPRSRSTEAKLFPGRRGVMRRML
jgi:hypothetical protein